MQISNLGIAGGLESRGPLTLMVYSRRFKSAVCIEILSVWRNVKTQGNGGKNPKALSGRDYGRVTIAKRRQGT